MELSASCSPPEFGFGPSVEASRCDDNQLNGLETDEDCGGGLCEKCVVGQSCTQNDDCEVGSCLDRRCQASHCIDQRRSVGESDVDCGGGECAKCGVSQHCLTSSDCRSNACMDGQCVATGCDDEQMGGVETDLDCGGGTCPGCEKGERCNSGGDCRSGICLDGQCSSEACADGEQGADEQGLDCGGSCPRACAPPECDIELGCGTPATFGGSPNSTSGGRATSGGASSGSGGVGGNDERGGTSHGGGPRGGSGEPPTGGRAASGGRAGSGGRASSGGSDNGSGGRASGGSVSASGGRASGGTASGGSTTGGSATGGSATGGSSTGGSATGGSATGGGSAVEACPGCARLSVPLAAANHKANFVIALPSVTNFSTAVITYRVFKRAGTGGEVKGYIQHGGSPDYAQLFQSNALQLSDCDGWEEIVWNVASETASYDKSIVARVGIQVTGLGSTAWTNPTIVYVDSISVQGPGAGPWNFADASTLSSSATISAAPNVLWRNSGDSPVAGSSVSWLGP